MSCTNVNVDHYSICAALAGTNVPDNLVQTEQNAASAWAPSTIHLSNTTPTSRNTTSEASATHQCDEPEIITQPHAEWHYRNMKEFEKKKLPFLPGEGPQRTPIRIKVIDCEYSKDIENAVILINRLNQSLLIQCIWLFKLKPLIIINTLQKYSSWKTPRWTWMVSAKIIIWVD